MKPLRKKQQNGMVMKAVTVDLRQSTRAHCNDQLMGHLLPMPSSNLWSNYRFMTVDGYISHIILLYFHSYPIEFPFLMPIVRWLTIRLYYNKRISYLFPFISHSKMTKSASSIQTGAFFESIFLSLASLALGKNQLLAAGGRYSIWVWVII